MPAPDEIWRRLASGQGLDGLGLSRVDGRWNLRSIGSPLSPWSSSEPLPLLKKVHLRDLDLSGAEMTHFRFFDCIFRNCIFDGASLQDMRMWGTRVQDCSFRRARIAGGMGGDQRSPNEWERVDFAYSDLRRSSHFMESYVDSNFSGAQLAKVDFEGSRHVRSVFQGELTEVEFRALPKGVKRGRVRNTMDRVDFGSAIVRFSTFHDLDLSSATLPNSPIHLRFEDRRLFATRVLAAADAARLANVWLRTMMEIHVRDAPVGGGGPGFQHREDLGDTAQEVADAVRLMLSCGAH